MAVKVRDILNFGGLLGSTVIAGEEGLDESIESVSVLEIADSSIARWVEPNQLYITSFYAIWDDVEQQKVVIENLKNSGVRQYLTGPETGIWPAFALTYYRPLYVMFHDRMMRDRFNEALKETGR